MSTFRIPASAPYNLRTGATSTDPTSGVIGIGVIGQMIIGKPSSVSAKDGAMMNCFVITDTDTITGKKRGYTVKSPGYETHTTPAAGKIASAILVWTGNANGDKVVTAFDNPSTIYDGVDSQGAITGICNAITETTIGTNTAAIVMSSNDNSGWYMAANATVTPFSGTPVSGSAVITGISSTTGLWPGQLVTGSGVPATTYILSTDSATQITLTAAVTERANIVFNAATAAQTTIVAGLTFTSTGVSTATQMAAAFANLANGATTGGGTAYGTYSGTFTGWTSGANAVATVLFTSVTASTDVTNITCTGTAGGTVTTNPVTTITPSTKMSKMVDVDFPGNAGYTLAGTFVHMDGYAAVMTSDGRLWAAQLNTLSGWVPTSFDSANAYPDKGIGAIRLKNMILCFGSESIQFFYNAGLTPFPFAKSQSQTIKIGAVSADAIITLTDTVFFAGSMPQGGLGIYQFDGGLSKISTPEIDSILILNGSTGITLSVERWYGRSFVNVITGGYTMVYCVEEKFWFERGAVTKLWNKTAGASVGSPLPGYAISTSSTSGKVYKMNHNAYVYTNDGVTITSRIVLPNEDHGTTRRKTYSALEIVGDIETSSCPIEITYSDDDYQTFTSAGTVNMSSDRPRLTRLGASRSRAWALAHSGTTKFRIEVLEGEYEVGQ